MVEKEFKVRQCTVSKCAIVQQLVIWIVQILIVQIENAYQGIKVALMLHFHVQRVSIYAKIFHCML